MINTEDCLVEIDQLNVREIRYLFTYYNIQMFSAKSSFFAEIKCKIFFTIH